MTSLTEHAHEPRQCKTTDLFKVEAKTEQDEKEVEDFIEKADKYLSIFVAPVRIGEGEEAHEVCFHCGSRFNGLLANLGVGAAIEWGLVHGEGHCTGDPSHKVKCGWPYRGMHYAKEENGDELFTLANVFLAYHPDQVGHKEKVA